MVNNDSFRALAHPIRRSIVERLGAGSATVGEATGGLGVSKPAISKHLRVLERAGLVTQGREAQWRPRSLAASPLREVAEYASGFRTFWEASHDRLDLYLRDLQAGDQPADDQPADDQPADNQPGDTR